MTQDLPPLAHWTARPLPGADAFAGRFVTIAPYAPVHFEGLYSAVAGPSNADIWAYMPIGPFADQAAFRAALTQMTGANGWRTMVISSAQEGQVLGMASYMRLRPDHGSAEIGTVAHGPLMRRTPASTQAHYLLARHVFEDCGYRRYEWKCNAENAASMAAAKRYGFTFEGIFRQDMVVKGCNRDTAWFSMIDRDWPALKARFEAWLNPSNFDARGAQIKRLEQL